MTRKDYILIAAALKMARSAKESAGYAQACDLTADILSNTLANDNPRFDRQRFLDTCGVQS
jgi:hypothetical protein